MKDESMTVQLESAFHLLFHPSAFIPAFLALRRFLADNPRGATIF
jgi:hypothetical protein